VSAQQLGVCKKCLTGQNASTRNPDRAAESVHRQHDNVCAWFQRASISDQIYICTNEHLDTTKHKAISLQEMMTLNALEHAPQQQEEMVL